MPSWEAVPRQPQLLEKDAKKDYSGKSLDGRPPECSRDADNIEDKQSQDSRKEFGKMKINRFSYDLRKKLWMCP